MKGGSAATASTGGRFSRIVKAPLRVLRRARDLYVSSMTGCAGRVAYSGVVGYPGGGVVGIPRSYSLHTTSSSSGEEDLRELIRAASQGAMGSLNMGGLRQSPGAHGKGGYVVPRSQSVAIGRIDEDRPCDFGEDYAMAGPSFPRSRSCAVPKWKVGVIP